METIRALGRLTGNEWIKITARLGTRVMIVLMLAAVIGAGVLCKKLLPPDTDQAWRQAQTVQNEQYRELLADPEQAADAGVREQAERNLAIGEYRLAHDVPPLDEQVDSMWGFAKITSMASPNLVGLVTLITIIAAAGIVSSEFSAGTIKLLLIRPFGRSTILLSKYLAVLLFALALLVLLIVSTLLTGGLLFGFDGLSAPQLLYSDGQVLEKNMLLYVLQTYALNSVELVVMTTFAFMISAAFRNSSLAIGISLFLLFAGPSLAYVLQVFDWSKYVLFANMDLRAYIDHRPYKEGMTMAFSLTVLAVYTAGFVGIAWRTFAKRDVSA